MSLATHQPYIQVVIATKYGKHRRTAPISDETTPLPANDDKDAATKVKSTHANITTHRDADFDRLMDDVDRIKARRAQEASCFCSNIGL